MAVKKSKDNLPRIRLVDREEGEEQPRFAVYALDRSGETLCAAQVNDEGQFDLPDDALEQAHRIVLGPEAEDLSEVESERLVRFRPSHFAQLLEQSSPIDVARADWITWWPFRRCIHGSVSHCTPWPFVVSNLVAQSAVGLQPRLQAGVTLQPPLQIQPSVLQLCKPVCDGLVEVYRRICCCQPWIIDDFRIPELRRRLEDLVAGPVVPEPPIPLPDPPPIEELPFFKEGAIDQVRLRARQDLEAINTLPRVELHEYIQARPYLWCFLQCGPGVKVAEGLIQADGEFNVCWDSWPYLLLLHCHEEFAFVVKQIINGVTVTIYDGRAANEWFHVGDDIDLVSYHPKAVTCKEEDVPPGPGAYAVLQDIGLAHSYRLKTPDAKGWDRVDPPADFNDGLADPQNDANAAKGKYRNRNWGGLLRLRYHFSEAMHGIGARYFRVSVARANGNGNPTGDRTFLEAPVWKQYVSLGGGDVEIENVSLGPHTVGGEANLYEIPYDNTLPSNREWLAGLFHAHLPTTEYADGRHLLTLEVFDQNGDRLRPNGAAGAGQDANFTFRRWFQEVGPTANVPFAALTHMLWWDNREANAQIHGLLVNGSQPSNADCQFLEADSSAEFAVRYRAYHPEPMFLLNHWVHWRRGLSSSTGYLTDPSPSPENAGPAIQTTNKTVTFGDMLGAEPRCSFALTVYANVKTFNGIGTLDGLDDHDTGAFALIQT